MHYISRKETGILEDNLMTFFNDYRKDGIYLSRRGKEIFGSRLANMVSAVGPQAFGTTIQIDANTDSLPVKEVCELLQVLDPYKLMGPENIHPKALKELVDVISRPLSVIFEKSWRLGDIPEDWKKTNVTFIYKKGLKEDPENYRPISLTSVPGKAIE
ncbi:rna-directed dna polymerase from mobile element hypothetical protein [Limosa lapponica baueri]|uniref:Rna-directed dna polymerase from mobile element jockey-like n=1 Tax=Limosa lapponica baueri TaxID=1758121 RepID=A0A2I0UTU0_LIMLA|nr:rna-directed dna polymerase from mobile element hypothetical protein [Limosa lapponica baueri]